jgi:hypothetical protein
MDERTNPKATNGYYLYNTWSGGVLNSSFGYLSSFSYGRNIKKQIQPVAWSGTSLIAT